MAKVFKLYTDGGARGNPGPAATGVVVLDESDQAIKEASKYLGEVTNNQAEYEALIQGLETVAELADPKTVDLSVYMDSELIVKQLKGEYRVKHEGLKPLYAKVQTLSSRFAQISFTHVLRAKNKKADSLVNRELDSRV